MIMPDDDYRMNESSYKKEHAEFVNKVGIALLDVARMSDADMLQLMGAMEACKYKFMRVIAGDASP